MDTAGTGVLDIFIQHRKQTLQHIYRQTSNNQELQYWTLEFIFNYGAFILQKVPYIKHSGNCSIMYY